MLRFYSNRLLHREKSMSNYNSKYHQTATQIKNEEDQIKDAVKNPAKFDVIYSKYFLAIYKYILVRVEDKHITDDIVSKVFAKALFKLKQYKFKGLPFSSWLYRIAYNEMNDTFRKKSASRVVQVPIDQIGELMDINDQEDQFEKEQRIKQVLNGIKKLNQDEIDLIEMRFFEKRAFKEMGEILKISEDNAKVKTHRALKKLKTIVVK